ncbi:CHAT domain-containing protein [Xylaria venustula]|nr:CHAT domain-containing protein [Xylaria venustula]
MDDLEYMEMDVLDSLGEGNHDKKDGYIEIDALDLLGEGSQAQITGAINFLEQIEILDEDVGLEAQDKLVTGLMELNQKPKSESNGVLDSAIRIVKKLYEHDATAKNYDLLLSRADRYAGALASRYWERGNPDDLHESIRLSEQVVERSVQAVSILNEPKGTILETPRLEVHALNTLAARLDERFQLSGSLSDLNRSIDIMERLIAAVPQESWKDSRAEWLDNLAASMLRRYDQSEYGPSSDLNRAGDLSREAGELTDKDSKIRRASALCSRALPLRRRAHDTKKMEDLDKAISLLREADRLEPAEHPIAIEVLINLAMCVFQKSEMSDIGPEEAKENLDEAIKIATSTVDRIPAEHPYLAHVHIFLGLFHYSQFWRSHSEAANPQEALKYLWKVLHSSHYPSVFRRVQAGRLILHLCCVTAQWQEGYKAAEDTVKLIPKLSSRGIRNSDKQRLLSANDVVGFGADAAAAALNAGKDGYAALRLLEMGRGSLAASVAELRPDLMALRKEHVDLAERFVEIRDKLQADSPGQHLASAEFDALLDEIRQKPGFKYFLKPPSKEDICAAAQNRPIVVLSASTYRGVDAILIEMNQVRVLSLKGLAFGDLEQRSRDLEDPTLLGWLWESIAEPILAEIKTPATGESLLHMWWIPTGILSKFPLHAAGYHSAGSTNSVIDRVVSSYSLSIKALVDARRRTYSPPPPKESNALLVAAADPPHCVPLGYVAEEIALIQRTLASQKFGCIPLVGKSARKEDVLQHLKECRIFHFAGHGKENILDPLRSTLLLDDWETNPLTVGSLLDVNLSQDSPFLAYLSACETGQVTRAEFHDESIHLIGAYQLAGFRHVIGTLWSVYDHPSVLMAAELYENLLAGEMTDKSVGRALHQAAKVLRDKAMRGRSGRDQTDARKINKSKTPVRDERSEFEKSWIPFVHFGI